jgi:hypothetical protein
MLQWLDKLTSIDEETGVYMFDMIIQKNMHIGGKVNVVNSELYNLVNKTSYLNAIKQLSKAVELILLNRHNLSNEDLKRLLLQNIESIDIKEEYDECTFKYEFEKKSFSESMFNLNLTELNLNTKFGEGDILTTINYSENKSLVVGINYPDYILRTVLKMCLNILNSRQAKKEEESVK